jgi:hypothetical protein
MAHCSHNSTASLARRLASSQKKEFRLMYIRWGELGCDDIEF